MDIQIVGKTASVMRSGTAVKAVGTFHASDSGYYSYLQIKDP